MRPFSGKIDLEYEGHKLYSLKKDFIYNPPKKYGYKRVYVTKGFKTDLASIPFFARFAISVSDDTNMGAVPHDYLYHTQLRSRKEADHIFLLAMEDANNLKTYSIALWKRQLAYRAVRIGGWVAWNNRAKEIKKIRKQLENDGFEKMEK